MATNTDYLLHIYHIHENVMMSSQWGHRTEWLYKDVSRTSSKKARLECSTRHRWFINQSLLSCKDYLLAVDPSAKSSTLCSMCFYPSKMQFSGLSRVKLLDIIGLFFCPDTVRTQFTRGVKESGRNCLQPNESSITGFGTNIPLVSCLHTSTFLNYWSFVSVIVKWQWPLWPLHHNMQCNMSNIMQVSLSWTCLFAMESGLIHAYRLLLCLHLSTPILLYT